MQVWWQLFQIIWAMVYCNGRHLTVINWSFFDRESDTKKELSSSRGLNRYGVFLESKVKNLQKLGQIVYGKQSLSKSQFPPLAKKKYLKMTALNKIFQKLPEPAATLLSTNEFFSESFWNIEFLVFLSYNRGLPFCMKRAIKQKIA